MASGNSRAGLFPNGGYSPTGTDDNMANGDIELQVRTPQKSIRHPSYENLDDRGLTEDANHQYEEAADIRGRNRGRSLPGTSTSSGDNCNGRRKKQEGDADCTDGYHKRAIPSAFKILAFAAFLLALVALVLVVLFMVGVLSASACRECKTQLVQGLDSSDSSKLSGSSNDKLWDMIKQLRSNLSELNAEGKKRDESISKLQREDGKNAGKIAELERKASYRVFVFNDTTFMKKFNISSFLGPQSGVKGEDGLSGLAGKTGPGNMTLCSYMSKEGVPFTPDYSGNGQNVIITESQGYRIIGATCSTVGASEYNLRSEINAANVRQYECECRGKSSVFAVGDGRAKCIMHYWMCALY